MFLLVDMTAFLWIVIIISSMLLALSGARQMMKHTAVPALSALAALCFGAAARVSVAIFAALALLSLISEYAPRLVRMIGKKAL